ncbi:MAG: hypothetical protein IJB79_03450 [Candidatus Gastranaerophilales bacterium]|nr:hypothetical protein [Candidatus Gastranaerophilales bacterium]
MGLFDFFKKQKTPIIKDNTFIVWEACSVSHSEVVPGFVKYLHDLGYHVSVLVDPDRIKEGLFEKFNLPNVTLNKIKTKDTRKFFKKADLSQIKGILVTTVGKIHNGIGYDDCYDTFNQTLDKEKLFLVEHDIKAAVDANLWNEKIITLREMDYKGAKSIAINPHYFGEVKITPKNDEIINFLTVGIIRPRKKNNGTIINAALELHKKGITNFKITVVGKGKIKDIPKEIQKYFDMKGRLPFNKMYEEIEKADFMITAYDSDNERHNRYITTGTSGNFQLIYGFLKPCLINEKYAPLNRFNKSNSIIYSKNEEYCLAMEKGIKMSKEEYKTLQEKLKETANAFYQDSLDNFKKLLEQ